jgi:hypothetical protein
MRVGSFAALVVGLLIPSSALADLPPPRDYVEKCTVEVQTKQGEECRLCGAYFASHEECLKLDHAGYQHRCRSYGASVWKEVWCRVAPKPPAGGSAGERR